MRLPMIAGNWKMNTTLAEARALVADMLTKLDAIEGVEKVVCPPFISLAVVCDLVRGTSIEVGAQNAHYEPKGAFTGEVSMAMLAELCRYVIIGHSERRQFFHESNGLVNMKVKAALRAGLTPIMCVGERLEENEQGKTEDVVGTQLRQGLDGVGPASDMVIAYEPVWAIGTGKAATCEQAQGTISFIRMQVAAAMGEDFARKTRVLYGGSVNAANISDLMKQPDIDGALVGGASLKAQEFVSIARQSALAKKQQCG